MYPGLKSLQLSVSIGGAERYGDISSGSNGRDFLARSQQFAPGAHYIKCPTMPMRMIIALSKIIVVMKSVNPNLKYAIFLTEWPRAKIEAW
jgi:hypothetical protein